MIRDEREARLFGACIAASVVLHASALALAPQLRPALLTPPQVLSVVLVEVRAPEPLPEAAVPRPPPKPEAARPRTRPAPPPRAQPAPEPAPAVAPVPLIPSAPASESPPPSAETARAPTLPAAVPRESFVAPDFRAAYLNNPPPAYPRSARRSGEQGTVTLRVHVGADGVPTQVELDRSSGSSALDSAALEAVKGWRFAPARRGADPVSAWVIVPVIFRLTPGS